MPNLNSEIAVVIPSASPSLLGNRSLLDIFGKPLIEHQIAAIYNILPGCKIVLVGGYQINLLRKVCKKFSNIKLIDNKQWENSGVAHSIALGAQETGRKKILIIYGDLIFTSKSIHDMIETLDGSYLLTGASPKKSKMPGINANIDGKISSMAFGLKTPWLQMAYFTDSDKRIFLETATRKGRSSWLFHEVINKAIDSGLSVSLSKTKSLVRDLDTEKDYQSLIED